MSPFVIFIKLFTNILYFAIIISYHILNGVMKLKHYSHLNKSEFKDIFFKEPSSFDKNTSKSLLAKSLGATMYMPATRESIYKEIKEKKHPSLTSMVIDLEDALEDSQLEQGLNNLLFQLDSLDRLVNEGVLSPDEIPLIFVRVRNQENFKQLALHKERLRLLTGFIFPKFSSANAHSYLKTLSRLNREMAPEKFYGMPVLETKEIIYKEFRLTELNRLKGILDQYKEFILNIRLGGTDLSGLFSIRRSIDTTIYDIMVVRDCLSDILNFFNRGEDDYVVSGVVWEFFSTHQRMLKPTLRETPFLISDGINGIIERQEILHDALDGLIREVILDKSNGIIGKTIIHPSHIRIVNALQVVSEEEYKDALMILNNEGKGVLKSTDGNKMNEMKPHLYWAQSIIEKSEIYGVLKDDKNYNSLF